MNILAFDTSTAQGGVAVLKNDKTLARLTWHRQGSHAEFLSPAIEKCLAEARLSIDGIDLLAVGSGPGSFTGARVSVNAARSFGYALGKKIFACSTNEILAAALVPSATAEKKVSAPERQVLTLVDAQKNLAYVATFAIKDGGCHPTSPIELLPLTSVVARIKSRHVCIGDACRTFVGMLPADLLDKNDLSQEFEFPDPSILGRLAFRETTVSKRPRTFVWNEVHALYLRASGAEEKSAKSE